VHDAIARDRICNFEKEEEMGAGKAHSGDFFFLVAELRSGPMRGFSPFFIEKKENVSVVVATAVQMFSYVC